MSKNEIAEAAALYGTWGWVIHPLTPPDDPGKSPGKRAFRPKWRNRTAVATDGEIIKWFVDSRHNLDVVCGKASNLTVVDVDDENFLEYLTRGTVPTLQSQRTPRRRHCYFGYNSALKAAKHGRIGLEILSDGSNCVVMPSVHVSGEVYRFLDPEAEIIEMPEEFERRLRLLFSCDNELSRGLSRCRPCFAGVVKRHRALDFHHGDGRELMLALTTELKANGAADGLLHFCAKLVYREEYDQMRTRQELEHIDAEKTWKCETLRGKFGASHGIGCSKCRWSSAPMAGGIKGGSNSNSAVDELIRLGQESITYFHTPNDECHAAIEIEGGGEYSKIGKSTREETM